MELLSEVMATDQRRPRPGTCSTQSPVFAPAPGDVSWTRRPTATRQVSDHRASLTRHLLFSPSGSRLLKAWIFDDSVTFWWAIISVSVVIFLLLAGFLIWYLLYARARKRQADASVDPMKVPRQGGGRVLASGLRAGGCSPGGLCHDTPLG